MRTATITHAVILHMRLLLPETKWLTVATYLTASSEIPASLPLCSATTIASVVNIARVVSISDLFRSIPLNGSANSEG